MTFYRATRIMRESTPALIFLLVFNLAAGEILHANEATFLAAPFLLILVPVLNGVGGDVGIVLGSRLTSGLYTGSVAVRFRDPGLWRNVRDGLVLTVLSLAALAIFIYGLALVLGLSSPFGLEVLLFVMVSSGLMLAGVLVVVSLTVALLSFGKGLDPDNFVTPVVTTMGDLLGIAFLVLVLGVVL